MRPRFNPVRRCDRCKLLNRAEHKGCRHCDHLTEFEVLQLRETHQAQKEASRQLGLKMLGAAIVLTCILLIALSGNT